MNKTIRCVKCRTEFNDKELEEFLDHCPHCGTKGLPMHINNDATIKINTHELRILGIWAENYAVLQDNQHLDDPLYEPLKDIVNIICSNLEKQLKEQGKFAPLTLTSEMKDLKDYLKENKMCDDIDFYRDGKEEII